MPVSYFRAATSMGSGRAGRARGVAGLDRVAGSGMRSRGGLFAWGPDAVRKGGRQSAEAAGGPTPATSPPGVVLRAMIPRGIATP